MNRCLFSLMVPFFQIIIFILIHLSTFLSADSEYHYQKCSGSYQCGGMNFTYPFWGAAGRPEFCGYPAFEVNCAQDILKISISSIYYRILGIDYGTNTLNVARDDYWDKYCPIYLHNTTLDVEEIFSYSQIYPNLTLYYGCSKPYFKNQPAISNYNLLCTSCTVNNTDTFWCSLTGQVTNSATGSGSALLNCEESVIVPVSESAMQTVNSKLTIENLDLALKAGFGLQWDANNSFCDKCSVSGGLCGRNVTTDEFICYCSDEAYVSTCGIVPGSSDSTRNESIPGQPPAASPQQGSSDSTRNESISGQPPAASQQRGSSAKLNWQLKIIIGFAVAGFTIAISVMIYCLQKRNKNQNIDAFLSNVTRYNYSDVKKMTNSFKDKLGQGAFGCVYEGKLSDGRLVAVKVLSAAKGNGEDFINEVASISRTSHVNIVNLLGFCYEKTKRALIYEFMPNGSLAQFIYDKESSNTNPHLEWKTLYEIAVGVARGLEYLHRGCNTMILHFDIKPHNILLDKEFCPKISDFGLAKLCQREQSKITMQAPRGTFGYIAPEVCNRGYGEVSYKSDVYSYGVMILEMVGGRRNIEAEARTSEIYYPNWIYKHLEPGVELNLHRAVTEKEEELARKMILVGLWCIQTKPSDRPSMTKVVEMLEGTINSLQIPPKPVLYPPPRSPQHSSSSTIPLLS